MKKMLMTAGLVLASVVGLNAQSITPRVEGGAAFSNARVKVGSSSNSQTIKPGFRAGAALEINLTDPGMTSIYLAPGVTYKMGGYKIDRGTILGVEIPDTSVTTHNISVPVNIGLRAAFASNMAVSVELGPYFAYALSDNSETKIGSINLNGQNTKNNAFDAGLGISAALEYSKFFVRLGSEFGFINQVKDAPKDYSRMTNSFYTTVGMRF